MLGLLLVSLLEYLRWLLQLLLEFYNWQLGFWVFCQIGMNLGLTSRDFSAAAVVAASGDMLTGRGQCLYQHIVHSSYEEESSEYMLAISLVIC